MKKLILASKSPRRREILSNAGFQFEIMESEREENNTVSPPEKLAVSNALIKAEDVFRRLEDKTSVVLGADTVVALDGVIFGKPTDKADAERMLRALSGKKHKVITGYALITQSMRESGYAETEVEFNDLSDEIIKDYVSSGLCLDKAGAYGIQDGYGLIKGYTGEYENVVGLPINTIAKTIEVFLK